MRVLAWSELSLEQVKARYVRTAERFNAEDELCAVETWLECSDDSLTKPRPLVAKRLCDNDDRMRRQLLEEAHILQQLEGAAHIVRYRAHFVYMDEANCRQYVLLMHTVPGQTMNDWFQGRNHLIIPDPTIVVRFGCQLLRALAAIHAKGIAHYDLMPTNVMIDTATLTPTIIDLGSATLTLYDDRTTRYWSVEELCQYQAYDVVCAGLCIALFVGVDTFSAYLDACDLKGARRVEPPDFGGYAERSDVKQWTGMTDVDALLNGCIETVYVGAQKSRTVNQLVDLFKH